MKKIFFVIFVLVVLYFWDEISSNLPIHSQPAAAGVVVGAPHSNGPGVIASGVVEPTPEPSGPNGLTQWFIDHTPSK